MNKNKILSIIFVAAALMVIMPLTAFAGDEEAINEAPAEVTAEADETTQESVESAENPAEMPAETADTGTAVQDAEAAEPVEPEAVTEPETPTPAPAEAETSSEPVPEPPAPKQQVQTEPEMPKAAPPKQKTPTEIAKERFSDTAKRHGDYVDLSDLGIPYDPSRMTDKEIEELYYSIIHNAYFGDVSDVGLVWDFNKGILAGLDLGYGDQSDDEEDEDSSEAAAPAEKSVDTATALPSSEPVRTRICERRTPLSSPEVKAAGPSSDTGDQKSKLPPLGAMCALALSLLAEASKIH